MVVENLTALVQARLADGRQVVGGALHLDGRAHAFVSLAVPVSVAVQVGTVEAFRVAVPLPNALAFADLARQFDPHDPDAALAAPVGEEEALILQPWERPGDAEFGLFAVAMDTADPRAPRLPKGLRVLKIGREHVPALLSVLAQLPPALTRHALGGEARGTIH